MMFSSLLPDFYQCPGNGATGAPPRGASVHVRGETMKMSYFRGSNIVTIQPRHRARHFPALGKVEAYWEALRNGRLMPTGCISTT